ncbi:MAG: triose-phosphate isomerase [Candidatus Puniceispirillales bacterium]
MFIAANWKMNLDKKSINYFIKHLRYYKFSNDVNVCIFPPTIYINFLNELIKNLPISIGGQNCHNQSFGAYTGEVSAISLKEFGCDYVILGHSERRIYNKETNKHIKKCAELAIETNLKPIICVGENLIERKNGNAINFIEKQIIECLPERFEEIIIAYEPIWSIGTGQIPHKTEIREMHKNITEIVSSKMKKNVQVLYGGSVNENNIDEILSVNNVNGVLVGGASLKIKDFLAIYSSAVKYLDKIYNIKD